MRNTSCWRHLRQPVRAVSPYADCEGVRKRVKDCPLMKVGSATKKSHHRHRRLLRACRERPRCSCAADQRDELASPHELFSEPRATPPFIRRLQANVVQRIKNGPLMSEMGQKPALPRRSIAVRFALNKQTLTEWVQCDAMCRVEMWRGGCRSNISVSASFVWRCLSGATMTPFPHPSHRTGHEDFPHPALGQDFTPSPTARRAQAGTGARARSTRKGARVDTSRPCVA